MTTWLIALSVLIAIQWYLMYLLADMAKILKEMIITHAKWTAINKKRIDDLEQKIEELEDD
jgi:cob(I)alamin adenosyltransferase